MVADVLAMDARNQRIGRHGIGLVYKFSIACMERVNDVLYCASPFTLRPPSMQEIVSITY